MPPPHPTLPKPFASRPTKHALDAATEIYQNPAFRKRRTIVYTGAVAAITVAGALLGAVLKTNEQAEQEKVRPVVGHIHRRKLIWCLQTVKQEAEINTTGQVSLLETRRAQLMQQKQQLEKKIEDLRLRQQKREIDQERRHNGLSQKETGR